MSSTERYLPIIDIAPTWSGGLAELERVAAQIDITCREHGFFYVTGHGIPAHLVERVFAGTRTFFSHPEDVKRRSHISLSPWRRGYDGMGHQSLDTGQPADLLEAYTVGMDFDPSQPYGGRVPRRGPNQWPAEDVVPGLQPAVEEYLTALERLSRHLMGLIALGLGLPRDHFEGCMRFPAPTLRLMHYPPQPAVAEPGQIGCGAHTDWGALTLLAQDDSGGLQVQDVQGQWHEVPPVAGSFIVNLGDLMARWTNDAYRSTLHRVINRVSGRDRYSLPYFFDIDHTAVVSALPGCASEANPPRYPPVTAGEHHQQKLELARSGYGAG